MILMNCPVCKTQTKEVNQEYCTMCAWEFEYFLGELGVLERKKYDARLKICKDVYDKAMVEPKVIFKEREVKSSDKTIQKKKLTTVVKKVDIEKDKDAEEDRLNMVFFTCIMLVLIIFAIYYLSGVEKELKEVPKRGYIDNNMIYKTYKYDGKKIDLVTAPAKYKLTVQTRPSGAKVQILNIKPKYRDGIELKQGRYKIMVSQQGYESKVFTMGLKKDELRGITLVKKKNSQKNVATIGNLMWQDEVYLKKEKEAQDNSYEYGKVLKYEKGTTFCKSLQLGGFNDWRLPSVDEMKNLYREKNFLKYIAQGDYISNTTHFLIWGDDNIGALSVFEPIVNSKKQIPVNPGGTFFVRCVRTVK